LPSGDHAGCASDCCANAASASFLSAPPVAAIRNNPPSVAWLRANASCFPSGDQAALMAMDGLFVRRICSSESSGFRKRSKPGVSGESPFHANTTRVPSGDSAGICSWPTSVVSGVTMAGCDPASSRSRHQASSAVLARKTSATVISQGKPRSAFGKSVVGSAPSMLPTNR
jgi:hypothetical protein